MHLPTTRRAALAAAAAALLGACAPMSIDPAEDLPPIVFVHGNGDTAGLWLTTIWRFEANGWPRQRLHAIDLPYPLARDDDGRPQPGRSSTDEHMRFLAAEVERVLRATGASKVALVANSRGGYAVRNYIANGGGAAKVSHAVLGGVPNHGVWADAALRPHSEFNGAGAFLRGLNAPQGPNGGEVTPPVRWMTIRSDGNDKFAQSDGVWIGSPGRPTHVSHDGPALKGADENLVIAGVDHRETSFGPQAFAATYRFITGRAPRGVDIAAEPQVVLGGKVTGLGLDNRPGQGDFPNNLPLVGSTLEVHAVDAASGERRGAALGRWTIAVDGRWGPLAVDGRTPLEFVIAAPGFAVTHVYRSPFARSSDWVHLRAERLADTDKDAAAVVTLTRPRGYFGVPRDRIALDGASPPAGIPVGVPGVSTAKLKLAALVTRPVVGEFNGERIVGRAWAAADNHVVLLELHD